MNCYQCSHQFVCIYFKRWDERFPYKTDGCIQEYINGLSNVLAKACKFYELKQDDNKMLNLTQAH
jgi:hypothetical protein